MGWVFLAAGHHSLGQRLGKIMSVSAAVFGGVCNNRCRYKTVLLRLFFLFVFELSVKSLPLFLNSSLPVSHQNQLN